MNPLVETLVIVGKRLGWMLLTLWIVYTFSFFLMRAVPGGPFAADKKVSAAIQRRLEARYHMDEPLPMQYVRHLVNAVVFFDFGPSMRMEDFTVNEVIAQGFPVSASLGVIALVLALLFGMTAGVISAVQRNTIFDFGFMLLATIGIAVPNFVLASLAIILIVFWLQLVPAAGWGSVQQLFLPAVCIAAPYAAYIARLTRAGMLEVLNLDYIRTAYAKGLAPRTVIVKHALRGAILPVVSYLGPATAGILTGSLVLEKIFNIPGMGSHFIDAAMQRDFTLAQGMVIVYTLLLLVMNTLVDLSYAVIDPRVKME
jgi:ABC-type dipeptide/oligopeptide/nickel transport system permease component